VPRVDVLNHFADSFTIYYPEERATGINGAGEEEEDVVARPAKTAISR
jgi:hypothetical protein